MKKAAILWFRNDLRLHDHEALVEALNSAEEVYPVYVFDERIFKTKTKFGFPKTGKYRLKFIIESVLDLRSNLRSLGTDLIVRIGKPEDVLITLANEIRSSWIFCNRERTEEEVKVQDVLEEKLWSIGQEVRYSRGKMLYYTADLPFPITHCPDVFTHFRKEVEKFVEVRPTLAIPDSIPKYSADVHLGEVPDLGYFGFEEFEQNSQYSFHFKGGETAGLDRLNYYFSEKTLASNYYETRNHLLGADYSTHFSPYLSQGCISPKMVYHKLKAYEAEFGSNKSTYWIFFELLWRDFFRLMGKKHRNHIFKSTGIKQLEIAGSLDMDLFEKWSKGMTGIPFVDANMKELNATGFMSNRGRQNVASFLVHDLQLNWLLGAEYFESLLLDYDPCSNYGNWNYIAGVGSDPREMRQFNIYNQASRYDEHGHYIKAWLPVLNNLPKNLVHNPSEMSLTQQAEYGVILGKDYPFNCVDSSKWV